MQTFFQRLFTSRDITYLLQNPKKNQSVIIKRFTKLTVSEKKRIVSIYPNLLFTLIESQLPNLLRLFIGLDGFEKESNGYRLLEAAWERHQPFTDDRAQGICDNREPNEDILNILFQADCAPARFNKLNFGIQRGSSEDIETLKMMFEQDKIIYNFNTDSCYGMIALTANFRLIELLAYYGLDLEKLCSHTQSFCIHNLQCPPKWITNLATECLKRKLKNIQTILQPYLCVFKDKYTNDLLSFLKVIRNIKALQFSQVRDVLPIIKSFLGNEASPEQINQLWQPKPSPESINHFYPHRPFIVLSQKTLETRPQSELADLLREAHAQSIEMV